MTNVDGDNKWLTELREKYPDEYLDQLDLRDESQRVGGAKAKAEDYALRRIPSTWRWNWTSVMWVVWGGVTFLYAFYLGGLVSSAFGTYAFLISAVVSLAWMIFPSLWFSYKSSMEGVSADLVSRGTFGYGGSAFSTFIYVFLWIYYFAAEGIIMASALVSYVPQIPIWGWEIVIAAIFVPLTLYGMSFLSKFQFASWFIWLPLVAAMVILAFQGHNSNFVSLTLPAMLAYKSHSLNFSTAMLATGAGFGLFVLWPLWAMDYGRFLKLKQRRYGTVAYWLPYTLVPWIDYVIGGFIALVAVGHQANPGVYSVYLLGAGGVILSIVTQLRINVENVYSGSLSFSNFFSRAIHWVPGRRLWVYVFIVVALIAMEVNILLYATIISTFFSIFLGAWITVMFVDYTVVRKWLKLPLNTEYRRAYLKNWNVPMMGAMWIAILINLPPSLQIEGVIGPSPSLGPVWYEASAWLFAIIESALLTVVFSYLAVAGKTDKRDAGMKFYFSRMPEKMPASLVHNEEYVCSVCHQRNYKSDYAKCPWYEGGVYLCSYCCMGTNCGNACKKSMEPQGHKVPAVAPHGFVDPMLAEAKESRKPETNV